MQQKTRTTMSWAAAAALSLFGFAATVPVRATDPFPEGPGKAVFIKVCTQCHAIEPIATLRHNKDEWKDLVLDMKGMGADATDEECNVIIDYLAKNFGKEEQK